MTNATEAERALFLAEYARLIYATPGGGWDDFDAQSERFDEPDTHDAWILWQAARAIPQAAAEPVAYPHPQCDSGCYYNCTKGGQQAPDCVAPDRAPAIAGFNVVLDESLSADVMEIRGANTVRCENVRAPSTDSATERDAARYRFLRDNAAWSTPVGIVGYHAEPGADMDLSGAAADEAIDLAIAAMKGEAQ